MDRPDVSVIVTVYNIEKYIGKCIESIKNQTLKNIEIILVDDGSFDSSGNICDYYSNIDKRIITYHKKNGGVSSARNFGISKINGEYFIFIDGDDYIKNDMLEVLYSNAKKYNCDVAVCNVVKVAEDGSIISKFEEKNKTLIYNREDFIKKLYDENDIYGYMVNKLIKTDLTKGILFDEKIKHLEDWDYLCRISNNINKIVYSNNNYYYYYVSHNNSAVHEKFNENWVTDLIARDKNINLVSLYDEDNRIRFYYDYIITALNTLGLHTINGKVTNEEREKLLTIVNKYYNEVMKSKYLSIYEKIKLKIKKNIPVLYFKLMDRYK